MDREPAKNDEFGDPRVYLAAERTLLAWIRTGLAMMGFGFVVARFGLFLREIAAAQEVAPPRQYGMSIWAGTALIVLGIAVNVAAAVTYWRMIRRLTARQPLVFHPFSFGSAIALLMALLGAAMAAYLLFGLTAL